MARAQTANQRRVKVVSDHHRAIIEKPIDARPYRRLFDLAEVTSNSWVVRCPFVNGSLKHGVRLGGQTWATLHYTNCTGTPFDGGAISSGTITDGTKQAVYLDLTNDGIFTLTFAAASAFPVAAVYKTEYRYLWWIPWVDGAIDVDNIVDMRDSINASYMIDSAFQAAARRSGLLP